MALGLNTASVDLGEFLEREIYPALFSRLDSVFPEYGFKRHGKAWVATQDDATRSLPGAPRADRVTCYANRPYALVVHGGEPVRFLDLVNGGRKPTGDDFPAAVRKLAELARVRFPDREVPPAEAERLARRHAHRSALETVFAVCREALASPAGEKARAYLRTRALDDEAQEAMGLGLYPSISAVEAALRAAGHDVEAARGQGLIFEKMTGYVVVPWLDAAGHPMTLYGRFPGTPPKDAPKLLGLPGEGTKASPLYFDRAREKGFRDLVLVEGLFDALVLQNKGEAHVVATMSSRLSSAQVETLQRHGVRSVTICLDPDSAGVEGTLSCIRSLHEKGIKAFVAPVLPDKQDPDEYVISKGVDEWKRLIGQREHAFRYMARAIVRKHEGEAWTDASLDACLDEAIALDAATTDPDRLTDLASFFWPEIQRHTGCDMDAVLARLEAVKAKQKAERERRGYEDLVRNAEAKLREGDLDAAKEIIRTQTEKLKAEERQWKAAPVRSVLDELEEHEARISQWRGREFIGLPQRTIPKLDEMTLGLRGLILLAAAPNVGKTTLAIQLGLDAVVQNQDAAFLFVSLEMSRWEILSRFKSRLAGIDYKTLVFGSKGSGVFANYFTREEEQALRAADDILRGIGNRIRVLDDENFPAPTLEKVLAQIDDLKASSGASRVFVLVDYLQVWPVPEVLSKTLRTDLDADKWRIQQMKELRDAINSDPVLVISEARKPNEKGDGWGSDMSDVMGSARGTYTPDQVWLLRQVSDTELGKSEGGNGDKEQQELGKKRRERDTEKGIAEQRLTIVKGRDGVQRGALDLRFYFRQSRFVQSSLEDFG